MYKSIGSFFVVLLVLANCPAAFGQRIGDPMSEEENIYQKIADVDLVVDGRPTKLSAIYHQRPVILAQVFTTCTGICSPSLLQLKKNLEALRPQQPYTVLVVSFDPHDTPASLRHFAHMLSVDKEPNWLFATTRQIDELNASVGFHPAWDAVGRQYDHDALLSGINRQGIIIKKLLGIRDKSAVSEMISQINGGFAPSYQLPDKRTLFSCFHYNSATGQYLPSTGFLIMLLPGVMTIALLGILATSKKRDRSNYLT